MNYYEELGLASGASPEEIRQAYRNLSRLLHPDQQSDETLRRLAEIQMKRLNAIHTVLSDTAERRKYDLGIRAATVAPRPDRVRKWLGDERVCLLVVIAAAGAGLWSLRGPAGEHALPRAVSPSLHESAAATRTGAPRDAAPLASKMAAIFRELSEARREASVFRAERDEARAEAARLAAREPEYSPASAPLPTAVTPAPAAMPVSVPAPAVEAARVPADPVRSFAGTWFYTRPKLAPEGSPLYPPVYIEAVIVEENGRLLGRYRARYHIADRAISPEVVFRFDGNAGPGLATLPWTGAGGAKGEVRLQLVGDSAMDVKWTASELGTQLGLASGTAVLVRRRDP